MKTASLTDIGTSREENQDSKIVLSNKYITFIAICDGMGGHPGGKLAANLTINAFKKKFLKSPPNKENMWKKWMEESIYLAIKLMNAEAKYNQILSDMGTTVTAAFIYEKKIFIFNIGDSRAYVYTDKLKQITIDHNLKNYYIQEHNISKEKAENIYGGNALTSALGPTKKNYNNVFEIKYTNDIKYIVLTTDGIHDAISKPIFELILNLNKTTIEQKCQKLVDTAKNEGSTDNLTVVIVEYC